ncbi:hypothetical protein BJY52DRAFT_1186822 [Lactarius psammicola]|nr:hypothetical protein BJY52DRAFT_1186822 [Lactarius psammicola]
MSDIPEESTSSAGPSSHVVYIQHSDLAPVSSYFRIQPAPLPEPHPCPPSEKESALAVAAVVTATALAAATAEIKAEIDPVINSKLSPLQPPRALDPSNSSLGPPNDSSRLSVVPDAEATRAWTHTSFQHLVDEEMDEYLRSLSEWVNIASEIHQSEPLPT